MDFDLNDEQRMFREAVRDFCEKELAPHAAAVDEKGELHWPAIHKMPALGLTGMVVPEEFGGADMDTISIAIAIEEIGGASVARPGFLWRRIMAWAAGRLSDGERASSRNAICRHSPAARPSDRWR